VKSVLAFKLLTFFCLMTQTTAFAQVTAPDSLASSWSAGPSLWSLTKLLLILGLVLGLVYVSLNALKKVTGRGGTSLKGVEVVGGVPLGPRRSLLLVKIAGKIHIIGATDHHLSAIGVIDDPTEIAEILSSSSGTNLPQFKDILSKLTGQAPRSPRGGANEG